MRLSIIRNGAFSAHFTGDLNAKCDLAKVAVYHYSVEIIATDEHLSPEGFIIENSRVQSWFENAYANPLPAQSCELIARHAALSLANILVSEGISVLTVKCTIQGSNGALLSAQWERD